MSPSTNPEKSKPERERQDWGIVLIILLIGFLCVIVSAQWALRFSPGWTLNADMGSKLDLNSEFLTSKPVVFFEPVDPAILTQPGWMAGFLTPGANVVTGTPLPAVIRTNTAPPAALGTTLVPTNTVAVTNTSTTVPTSTLIWLPLPATSPPKPKDTSAPPADTPTNTSPPPLLTADLEITNTDSVPGYGPGDTLTYAITVTNHGPDNVTGATVTNTFDAALISSVSWTCGGAACPAAAGSGNINNLVNLPNGASINYTVTANIFNTLSLPSPSLTNTVSVSLPPVGYNPDPGMWPNSVPDTDVALLGAGPDCTGPDDPDCKYELPTGNTLTLSTSIEVEGTGDVGNWDLVYYERRHLAPAGIYLDVVEIQIGNGTDWYTVFRWGDDITDPNTIITPLGISDEYDNRFIAAANLYNSAGVAIDIDNPALNGGVGIPPGTYTYISVTASVAGDTDGTCGIDAVEVLP